MWIDLGGTRIKTVEGTTHFSESEDAKLAAIEAGATADQSNAEIETAYNAQVAAMSQAEAETGTDTAIKRVTAERIKQAIDALGGGTVKQIFATKMIFTSTAATRTAAIFGTVVKATDAEAQVVLNSAITALDDTIFLITNSKTSTITFALNDDGVDVLQVSTTSGQTGEFSATGSVVVAAGSKINFTFDGGTSSGQLDFSQSLEYIR